MTGTTRLGNLVSILGGGTPSRNRGDYYNGDIPWVTVKDLKDELTLSSSQERITKLGLENSASRLVPAGNVIVATRMAVGKAVRTLVDVAINQDLKAVVCGQRIDSRFLLFFLHSKASLLEAKASGSTVKGILIEDLQDLEVVLPPLPKQQRIAVQLEQADKLRRTRRYALELTDTFLPAAFLELFGAQNPAAAGWPADPLGEHLEAIEGGVNFNPVGENDQASDWRVLKVSAVSWSDFLAEESKPISPTESFGEKLIVKRGDLIMSRANTVELVGAVARVRTAPPKVLLPDKLWRLKFPTTSRLLPDYLLFALRSGAVRREIEIRASGTSGSMKNISKEDVRALRLPLPPLPLQQKFTALVDRVENLRAVQHEALRQAERLFATLLHRAFSD